MRYYLGISFRRRSFDVSSLQESVKKLPLPLGEGWGEGLAREAKRLLFSSLSTIRRAGWKKSKSLGLSARPSPRPSPKGRGGLSVVNLAESPFVIELNFRRT